LIHPSQEEFCKLWGRLMQRAWDEPEFRSRLAESPVQVLKEHGYELPADSELKLEVVQSDAEVQYLYLPCPDELRENTAPEAAETAADCLNNQLSLQRLFNGRPDDR
jgi:hypothetical protein